MPQADRSSAHSSVSTFAVVNAYCAWLEPLQASALCRNAQDMRGYSNRLEYPASFPSPTSRDHTLHTPRDLTAYPSGRRCGTLVSPYIVSTLVFRQAAGVVSGQAPAALHAACGSSRAARRVPHHAAEAGCGLSCGTLGRTRPRVRTRLLMRAHPRQCPHQLIYQSSNAPFSTLAFYTISIFSRQWLR